MPKHPIAWHEECLKNGESYLMLQRLEAKALMMRVAEAGDALAKLRSQIARAKRLGKDGFDADKFQPEKGGE